ncbi:MAG: hypothetical protein KC549_18530, partial [Myxococcales bacterium]|nr:hypothetical protein [Myxococcales bacterium]
MSKVRLRVLVTLGWFLALAPTGANAVPEGTRNLQINQGLLRRTPVNVFARAGELIRFCSSDDGHNDTAPLYGNCIGPTVDQGGPCAPCEGAGCDPVGINGGARWDLEHPVDRGLSVLRSRRGAEILLSAPTPRACQGDLQCDAGQSCRSRPDGAAWSGGEAGYCAWAFPVEEGRGFCSAWIPEGSFRFHEHRAEVTGHWTLDFVGERYSISTNAEPDRDKVVSTRYFEIDVRLADGRDAPPGRVSALAWRFTGHARAYPSWADFFVAAPGQVYVLDLTALAGWRWALEAGATGLAGRGWRSACLAPAA